MLKNGKLGTVKLNVYEKSQQCIKIRLESEKISALHDCCSTASIVRDRQRCDLFDSSRSNEVNRYLDRDTLRAGVQPPL